MINRNVIIGAVIAGVLAVGTSVAVLVSSSETPDKIDLSSIHTAETPTEAPETTAPPETTTQVPTQAQEGEDVQSLSYQIAAYESDGKIRIEYPVISQMTDEEKQARINQHLMDNALSLLKAWDTEGGKCTITVKCQVPSLTRKRITAVYTGSASQEGAAHPVNLFYTNTYDLTAEADLGLSDFADPYTMAGYVLSDDVQFADTGSASLADALAARQTMDVDYYTEIFTQADFPFDAEKTWPSSFSYERQGEIYFSIPVEHAIGDYVIVKFTPDTK